MSNKVSVVILNYNGKEFVGECVDSVLGSDYPDFEIVVVDNGSSDGSYSYLKERYKKKGRVRVFRIKKNRYFTGGLNFGAKRCKGEKIVFLSNDIVVEKTFLSEMVKFGGERKKLLVQPKILFYKER
jgi:GT2 family glycosyltransferase